MENTTRLTAAEHHYAKLLAHKEVLTADLNRVTDEVGHAKHRVSLKPQIDEVLSELQRENHQRTVGMYEVLLTQVMQDVMPNESKKVAMALGTTAGVPSLDILIEREAGHTEDILTGNGGSVANVISAGLRFIALSRTHLRKFLVLDESDCWLSPARIASFSNVVSQMGTDLGVQSLVISHHDVHLFAQSASSIVSLTRNDQGQVEPNYVYDLKNAPREGQIEFIRMVDFMSHADTTIPFSSGMTAIVGENDIGKSAIVAAISALSGMRAFKKEYVRHGAASASVFMGLVGGNIIECTRYVKGGRTVVYRMTDACGIEMHKTETGEPVWLKEILGIHTEGGLDIQIGDQKSPVFLLDESGAKQAAILSVGRESSLISAMQAEYKKDTATDKQVIKAGEEHILALRQKLTALEALPVATLQSARDAMTLVRKLSGDQIKLVDLESALGRAAKHHAAWGQIRPLSTPRQAGLQPVGWLSDNLSALRKLQGMPSGITKTPVSCALGDTSLDLARMTKLSGLKDIHLPSAPTAGVLRDGHVLGALLSRLAVDGKARGVVLPVAVAAPLLAGVAGLPPLLVRLTLLSKTQGVVLPGAVATPVVGDPAVLNALLARLARRAQMLALPSFPAVSTPVLGDAGGVGDAGRALQSAKKMTATLHGDIEAARVELNDVSVEHDAVVESLGGVCPLCNSTMKLEHV